MTDTMLEKAARAMNAELPYPSEWMDAEPSRQALCYATVRAVLTAIREPDEAMRARMVDALADYDPEMDSAGWRTVRIFHAGVDAILAEEPKR